MRLRPAARVAVIGGGPSGLLASKDLHAFDYPGADALPSGRTLVYGNGVSGHEIAADIAARGTAGDFGAPRPDDDIGVSATRCPRATCPWSAPAESRGDRRSLTSPGVR